MESKNTSISRLSITGLIVTLGIVYGDLGTSPLYVLKAIISGSKTLDTNFILGALSCIIWTLTLQTTVKYVFITLRADNKGEGGIFALYALIRRRAKWVFIFAIIGGSTLLADGIITPAITVVSAVEGLALVNSNIPILPIVLVIILGLFFIQKFGTNFLGNSFGPIMFIWFSMLGVLGIVNILDYPVVLKAFNPVYAYKLLSAYPNGFVLLGAVFLCTTGAEALYSDLGHCGLNNIRVTWFYVKITLILNYLGQGAWILTHTSSLVPELNPFYAIMPEWFLMVGILISTAAAIIASQALISGSYTIISEAIRLNFWPKVKIVYPTVVKGQMYIPSINWFLCFSCIIVILLFKKSSNMEAAYGLSITLTMLMTTVLMGFYLYLKKVNSLIIIIFLSIYFAIEGSFLIANLNKFINGGWFTILCASILLFIMYVWYKARNIKKRFLEFIKIENYKQILKDLNKDTSVPKYATNLVYITKSDFSTDIESKIIYSILNKQPKRADIYWFIHVHDVDDPHTLEYKVEHLIQNILIRVDIRIGFKVESRINLFYKQVLDEMVKNNEIDIYSHYESLRKHRVISDFRFVVIDRIQTYDFNFSAFEQFIMDIYSILKNLGISDVRALGLDTSNVTVENVPLLIKTDYDMKLKRIN